MTSAVRTEGLTKDYGAGHGLFDLDLEVPEGQAFGYLGPNGAGKTTTIRLLMGLIHPTRGRATIFGLDCQSQAVEVKRHVGYVPGEPPDFGGLRGREWTARSWSGFAPGSSSTCRRATASTAPATRRSSCWCSRSCARRSC
jgi:ABC-type multidrug transport system ATPase subunit